MGHSILESGISKFFKNCLQQNLLSPLLNTLSHIILGKLLKDFRKYQLKNKSEEAIFLKMF